MTEKYEVDSLINACPALALTFGQARDADLVVRAMDKACQDVSNKAVLEIVERSRRQLQSQIVSNIRGISFATHVYAESRGLIVPMIDLSELVDGLISDDSCSDAMDAIQKLVNNLNLRAGYEV